MFTLGLTNYLVFEITFKFNSRGLKECSKKGVVFLNEFLVLSDLKYFVAYF